MARGGKRSGAGRKRMWNSGPADKPIKVPTALAERVLAFARELDADPLAGQATLSQSPGHQQHQGCLVQE